MKTTIFKLVTIMLIATGISLTSCKERDTPETMNGDAFLEKLKSAPHAAISKENFPEWLANRINEIEAKPHQAREVQIYKGEWDKQPVYFIMDTFSSCFCDFYTEEGVRIVGNLTELYESSKNWTLIYKYELPF
ncbi:MAG: hypothetical protein LBV41_09480 [Cytophagaceae bacterium]|jgi:hypothetical protein|nr:hypothetical protein [Cytophagaceae bacterium]